MRFRFRLGRLSPVRNGPARCSSMAVPAVGKQCTGDAYDEADSNVAQVVHPPVEAREADQQRNRHAAEDDHPSRSDACDADHDQNDGDVEGRRGTHVSARETGHRGQDVQFVDRGPRSADQRGDRQIDGELKQDRDRRHGSQPPVVCSPQHDGRKRRQTPTTTSVLPKYDHTRVIVSQGAVRLAARPAFRASSASNGPDSGPATAKPRPRIRAQSATAGPMARMRRSRPSAQRTRSMTRT